MANDSGGATGEARLESWKRIAAYLKRDVTTVQRWERREAMPVYRHQHDKQGSVYAFKSELDTWWASRGSRLARTDGGADAPPSGLAPEPAHALLSGAMSASATPAPTPTSAPPPPPAATPTPTSAQRLIRAITASALALGALLIVALLVIVGRAARHRHADELLTDPMANASSTRLTITGTEQAAAISRDGRFVAYLATADGHMDAWLSELGGHAPRNLTQGQLRELSNPSIRTLGFSPDGSFVSVWTRSGDGAHPEDIQLMSAPTTGGPLAAFMKDAAEVDWSRDGKWLVFHTTAPGDPLFVRDATQTSAQQIYVAPPGVHCHFPTWSPDGKYIYFVRGEPPDHWDLWRLRPDGTAPERMTFHNARVTYPVALDALTWAYLATDADGSGPWLNILDIAMHRSHRVTTGIGNERYTSLSASADGRHVAATLTNAHADVWRVAIDTNSPSPAPQTVAIPAAPAFQNSLAPRYGPGYRLFVSDTGNKLGLYKQVNQTVTEIWSDTGAARLGVPAIAPDGSRIAFAVTRDGSTDLEVMDSDGGHPHVIASTLALRGDLSWSPDAKSIIGALVRNGEPRLAKIPLDGSPPQSLASDNSIDPVWSPDGNYYVYSGADVGTTFPVRAAGPDGRPYQLASLILTRGARRVAFTKQSGWLVILRGDLGHKDFWLWDPQGGAERQLTKLPANMKVGEFDVSPDGSEITFERVQENYSIALIERPHGN